jgi:hypothetical protein
MTKKSKKYNEDEILETRGEEVDEIIQMYPTESSTQLIERLGVHYSRQRFHQLAKEYGWYLYREWRQK